MGNRLNNGAVSRPLRVVAPIRVKRGKFNRTLRAFGKCLDVRGAGVANATPVQLFDCNSTAAQQWVTRPDGTILNPQSGRCLDDAGGFLRAGDRLQIYDCNGTAAQGFRLA